MGTGQDYALDPQLMEACQQVIEPQLEAFRNAGAVGPEVAIPEGASAQTRFLALLGRTGLCRKAGADPEAIPAWIEEGRRRKANANRPPFSDPHYRRPGRQADT